MLVGGVLLVLLGALLLTSSAIASSRANPSAPLPAWSNPPVRPRAVRTRRGLGAGLAVLGGALAGNSIGFWSVVLVVAAFSGALVVQLMHNHELRTRLHAP